MKHDKTSRSNNMITQCRTALQLTQSDLARLFGISRSYFNLMEKGQRPMPTQMLLDLLFFAGLMEQPQKIPGKLKKIQKQQQEECAHFFCRKQRRS